MGAGERRPDDSGGRRKPPVAATGLEEEFLELARQSRVPIAIRMRDGRTLRGVLESFDRDLIELREAGEQAWIVRKSEIRYLQREDE